MKTKALVLPLIVLAAAGLTVAARSGMAMPVGNAAVPQPAKAVDLARYGGKWFELGRYENRFEKDCEGVTAEYGKTDDGQVSVTNACHKGSLTGEAKVSKGKAKVMPGSNNAKLKVSFFGPFYVGDYWVLDHADDYSWSIVGEPSGKYLWLLSRTAAPAPEMRQALVDRAAALGYDTKLIRPTKQ